MKTTIILISILGMACAFSMKNLYRRVKLQDSEENGVFKYWPRYSLYKHAYFYPPLKRFPVQSLANSSDVTVHFIHHMAGEGITIQSIAKEMQSSSDSSEENGDGDSSEEEEGEEEETSNEEEENEESSENEDEESENSTLSFTTPAYGAEITLGTESIGLSAIQLPKKAGETGNQGPKKKESDEEEEEEEENEEAEVDENKQGVNGTSTNSTEVDSGNGNSGGDNGEEEGEEEGATVANTPGTTVAAEQDNGGFETIASPDGGFEITTPAQDAHRTTTVSFGGTTTAGFEEYEQTGTSEYDNAYEVYESENGEPRGDTYRAYEDEYSYYKGQSYDGYGGQDYFYHR